MSPVLARTTASGAEVSTSERILQEGSHIVSAIDQYRTYGYAEQLILFLLASVSMSVCLWLSVCLSVCAKIDKIRKLKTILSVLWCDVLVLYRWTYSTLTRDLQSYTVKLMAGSVQFFCCLRTQLHHHHHYHHYHHYDHVLVCSCRASRRQWSRLWRCHWRLRQLLSTQQLAYDLERRQHHVLPSWLSPCCRTGSLNNQAGTRL